MCHVANVDRRVQFPLPGPKIGLYFLWMLKLAAVLLAAFITGCATAPENRINITIKNDTPMPIVIKGGNYLGSTSITIPPGVTWSGWIDRRIIFSPTWVVIEPFLKTK